MLETLATETETSSTFHSVPRGLFVCNLVWHFLTSCIWLCRPTNNGKFSVRGSCSKFNGYRERALSKSDFNNAGLNSNSFNFFFKIFFLSILKFDFNDELNQSKAYTLRKLFLLCNFKQKIWLYYLGSPVVSIYIFYYAYYAYLLWMILIILFLEPGFSP